MCPACIASAAFLIASAISTGGVSAVVLHKLGAHQGAKKSIQKSNPKEETWEK